MRAPTASGAIRTVAAACAGIVLTGCLTTDAVYPSTWPDPVMVADGACPLIDGNYRNAGESVKRFGNSTTRERRSLAHILNGGSGRTSLELWNRLGHTADDPARDPFVSVSLKLAGNELEITAESADGTRRQQSLPVATQCRDSVLALEVDWGRRFIVPMNADDEVPGRISLALGRAEDGSLLLRETEAGTLMFLFMPVASFRDEAWLRFQEAPVASTAAGAP